MKSDSDLQDDIRAELRRQFSTGAQGIEVRVLDGVVTLTGHIESGMDRWRLDDAVRALTGVRAMIDETMIVPETPGTGTDADIARPWFPAG